MASEIAVDAAIGFVKSIPDNRNKPFTLAFSVKSSATDIFTDAKKFSDQLVAQVNQSQGTDLDSTTLNIDEFTRMASGDNIKTYSGITDRGEKATIRDVFDEITGGKSLATAADIAEYLRLRDVNDGATDGHAVLNFLI